MSEGAEGRNPGSVLAPRAETESLRLDQRHSRRFILTTLATGANVGEEHGGLGLGQHEPEDSVRYTLVVGH